MKSEEEIEAVSELIVKHLLLTLNVPLVGPDEEYIKLGPACSGVYNLLLDWLEEPAR